MQMALVLIVFSIANDLAKPENRWLYDKRSYIARRDAVLGQLERTPGKKLVFVDYGKGHDVNQEWVYNRADIDGSRIVWAREMGTERDRELIEYYQERQLWKLVDDGDVGVRLWPISATDRTRR